MHYVITISHTNRKKVTNDFVNEYNYVAISTFSSNSPVSLWSGPREMSRAANGGQTGQDGMHMNSDALREAVAVSS